MDPYFAMRPAPVSFNEVPSAPFVSTLVEPTAAPIVETTITYLLMFKVFLAALSTSVTAGLGALPFLCYQSKKSDDSSVGLGLMNSCAAGMMLGASIILIFEGLSQTNDPHQPHSLSFFLGGLVFGISLMIAAKHLLSSHEDIHFYDMKGASAQRTILVVGVMFLHSFAEGVSIGVSFGGGSRLATLITVSLAVHNIPEGLAIIILLLRKGVPLSHATGWSVLTSLPQPLMAVPAFVCVAMFRPFLPFGLGFAGSAMLWVTFTELIPEARSDVGSDLNVLLTAGASFALMIAASGEF